MTDRTRPDHTALDRLRARVAAGHVHDLHPHDRGILPSQEDPRPRRPPTFGCCPAPEPPTARAWDAAAAAAGYGTADRNVPGPTPGDDDRPESLSTGVLVTGDDGRPVGYVPLALMNDDPDDESEREPTPGAAAVLRERIRAKKAEIEAAVPDVVRALSSAATAPDEATRYWLGTCPEDGVHIGIKHTADDPNAPLVMRTGDSIDSTCLCGTTLTLRLVSRAEYEDVLGPDDDDPEDDDDPDDGAPFHPRWPLLVSEDTKRELLDALAEAVHAQDPPGGDPRAIGPAQSYRRGYETGMAKVMLMLGINEAGSPERKSLPRPDDVQ